MVCGSIALVSSGASSRQRLIAPNRSKGSSRLRLRSGASPVSSCA